MSHVNSNNIHLGVTRKIVVTGGGTLGHVFPALAIAEELKKKSFRPIYVGGAKGLETKLVPERQIEFFAIRSGALKNQGIWKKIRTLGDVLVGIFSAIRLLRFQKPQAVIGVGGYVSAPVCVAAYLLRIPVYLQEQNVSVGIANRLLSRISRRIFIGFKEAEQFFPKAKCIVTGNPIRPEFYDSPLAPFKPSLLNLLILGGSQGSRAINNAMVELLPKLTATYPGLTITHQTGSLDFETVKIAYDKIAPGRHLVTPFINDMVAAYQQACLVIARSGALTVSELIQVARPAIFVPYPRQGQNDQTANAYFLQAHGCAKVVEQGERFTDRLFETIVNVFTKVSLSTMHAAYSKLQIPRAAATICAAIEKDLNTNA